MDHLIATELTQQVLQARRLRGELAPERLDSVNRRLYGLAGYRSFIADVDEGDSARPNAPHSGLPVRAGVKLPWER